MKIGTIKILLEKIKKGVRLGKQAEKLKVILNQEPNDLEQIIVTLTENQTFRLDQKKSEILHLLNLIKTERYRIICEIGAFRGGSLFAFSQVAPKNAVLISIDKKYPYERRIASKSFAREGQRIYCIQGDSHNHHVVEQVNRYLGRKLIDILFIDGDHSLFGVMNDYVRFSPLVKKGGIIAFHDIHPDSFMRTGVKTSSYVGGVPLFWESIKRAYYKTDEIIEDFGQDGFGIGILFKE